MAAHKISNFSVYWFGKNFKELNTEELKCYKRNMMRKHVHGILTSPEEAKKSLTSNSNYAPALLDDKIVTQRRQRYDGYKQKWDSITCSCGCVIKTSYSGETISRHMTTPKHKRMMGESGRKERSVIYLVDSQWNFTDEELLRDVSVSGAV